MSITETPNDRETIEGEPRPGARYAAALAAFQAELPKIGKDNLATVTPKDGKAGYKYTYADLADISAKVLPLLGKQGLAWSCKPTLDPQGRFALQYTLMHESGESDGGWYPLTTPGNPQAMGSAITYARRYTLCAVTGAVADEDDDGAAAQRESERRPAQPQAQQRNGHPPAAPSQRDAPDSPDQTAADQLAQRLSPADRLRKSVHYVLRSKTLTEAEERLVKLSKAEDLQDKKVGDLIDQESAEKLGLDDALRATTTLLELAEKVCGYLERHNAPVVDTPTEQPAAAAS